MSTVNTDTLATELTNSPTKRTRAEINRENAQKSTGPRTPEGKSIVRFNATRHKLTSQIVLLPEGDFAAYTDLLDRFTADYAPQGEGEITLVAQMANATWRLNQSQAYEMSLMALHFNPDHPRIAKDNPLEVEDALATAAGAGHKSKELANLSLYRTRDFRIFERAMAKLEALQTARKAQQKAALNEASQLMRLHQADQEALERQAKKKNEPFVPQPYHPLEDGFVFSAPEIVNFVARKYRGKQARLLDLDSNGALLKAAA